MRLSSKLRCARWFLLAIFACGPGAAQDRSEAPAPVPSTARAQSAPAPIQSAAAAPIPVAPMGTIRATSRIVYVDVIVRDGAGKIVHGLQRDNFRIAEDRQPQKVSLFQAHVSPAQVLASQEQVRSKSSAVEISNRPPLAQDGSLNILLLDLLNTSPQDQVYARKRMIEFLKVVPPGRQVALFTLTNGLHMIQSFTIDSAVLARAAASIKPAQLNRLRTPNQTIADNDATAYIDFAVSGGTWGQQNLSNLGEKIQGELGREDIQNMRARLDATNVAFTQLARAVNGYGGRKNLFWMAGQFPSNTYYTLQSLSDRSATPATGARSVGVDDEDRQNNLPGDEALSLGTLSERANRAIADSQIAVYPISLVGVQTDLVGAESSGIGSASARSFDTANVFFNERQNGREVMNHIADETGGEAFYGNNDPATMLRKGFDDGENYYTLAYQPTDHNWNGQLRHIKVSLNGDGYQLSYRRSYLALPEQPAANTDAQFALAMRMGSPPSTALVLRATPPMEVKPGVMQLDASIDLQGIGFTVDDANQRRGRLQVRVLAYPVSGPTPAFELNSVMKVGLTAEDYAAVSKTGIPIRQSLHLPAGQFLLCFGVLDLDTGRIGTLTLPVTVGSTTARVP